MSRCDNHTLWSTLNFRLFYTWNAHIIFRSAKNLQARIPLRAGVNATDLLPPASNLPGGENSTSRVALGTKFGATFRINALHPHAAYPSLAIRLPRGQGAVAERGRQASRGRKLHQNSYPEQRETSNLPLAGRRRIECCGTFLEDRERRIEKNFCPKPLNLLERHCRGNSKIAT